MGAFFAPPSEIRGNIIFLRGSSAFCPGVFSPLSKPHVCVFTVNVLLPEIVPHGMRILNYNYEPMKLFNENCLGTWKYFSHCKVKHAFL